ncbi:MAG: IS110 family transposase [Tenericutes bacterium HGW-Tenericutes-3]|jgi:transposase|nr:MAG: IS110 family transposase [Tenericutes bacterium HGW-Tenericutes-3]
MSISKLALDASSQDYINKKSVTYPVLKLYFGGVFMYLIGIDISKYKHDCFIATEAGESIKAFSFENNRLGFDLFLKTLKSLDQSKEIRIGLESTGHYGANLKQFITTSGYTYLEFNPYLTHMFSKALSLRKTKTDKVDAKTISSMLGSVDYKTLHTRFYHINELKQLVRYRHIQMVNRSKTLIEMTNILDRIFPEFKPSFNERLAGTAIFILRKFKSVARISKLSNKDYEAIRSYSKGRLSYAKVQKLKSLASSSVGYETKSDLLLLKHSIKHYEDLTQVIDSIEQEIISIMEQMDQILTTIPGITLISAAIIIAELGDFKNFTNPAQIVSFSGLDTSVNQSGMMETRGHLVKRGSGLLRMTFWQITFTNLRLNPKLYDYYLKKRAEGKHHKVAMVHCARKLIRTIYYLGVNQLAFDYSQFK